MTSIPSALDDQSPLLKTYWQGAGDPGESNPAVRLTLTEFLDLKTLQELQDSLSTLTRMPTAILDSQGRPITAPTDALSRASSDAMLEQLLAPEAEDCQKPLIAPIVVEGQQLGSVAIEPCQPLSLLLPQERQKLAALYLQMGVQSEQIEPMLRASETTFAPRRAAAVQTLFLLANHLAKLCYQAYQLRERVQELNTLNRLSSLLAGRRDVQQVLDTATRSAAEAMELKASTILLLSEDARELVIRSAHQLSPAYIAKGPILVEQSLVASEALAGQVVYVEDMAHDPRVLYPEDARREGLVSFLSTALVYHERPIGVIQVYAAQRRRFSRFDVGLLQSIAQLTAAAIENARLDAHRLEAQKVQRQVSLAADVQRRMMPSAMPRVNGLDIAARYVPSLELSGDFYDFISLNGHLGIAVGDVVGKGVAASLLMAGVRASLRAFAQDVYDIDQIIARVNIALCRDTLPNEFATLFYGVYDPARRCLTYCNAGHEPPLLLRKDQVLRLEAGGMIVGIDRQQHYDKEVVPLEPGDLLLFHTDGLTDALNFNNEKFGRQRVIQAMRDMAFAPAQDALNHVLWQMRRFVGLNRPHDDTTLVVIQVGKPG